MLCLARAQSSERRGWRAWWALHEGFLSWGKREPRKDKVVPAFQKDLSARVGGVLEAEGRGRGLKE